MHNQANDEHWASELIKKGKWIAQFCLAHSLDFHYWIAHSKCLKETLIFEQARIVRKLFSSAVEKIFAHLAEEMQLHYKCSRLSVQVSM